MNSSNYLEKEKVWKLLIKFSVPCIMSLLISALYNIVDQIFIGNSSVGAIGNTATTIVFPLTVVALAVALMLGDGAAAYISLCQGRNEKDKISASCGSVISLSLILSVCFLAVCFPLLDNILYFFGAKTTESLLAAREYGFIILIGVPFYIIMNMLNSVIRADGSPKISMISMVTGAVINIILDAVFILALDMGLTGAALATIIGQIASFVISVVYMFRTKTFKLKLGDLKIRANGLLKSLKLGLSSFLTQISIVIISVVSMNQLATYGMDSKYGVNDPQAIVGIVMKVFSIVINIAVGIAAGAQPIVGYNYGAGRIDRVKQTYKLIIISNLIIGAAATVLLQTMPAQIIGIFGENSANPEAYREFGILTVRIYLSLIIFTMLQKVTSIFLQSMGCPVRATILSVVRDIVAFVPFTLILPLRLGIIGILWAAPAADTVSMILTVILTVMLMKKLNSRKAATQPTDVREENIDSAASEAVKVD